MAAGSPIATFEKDPVAVAIDYTIDIAKWLEGDRISSAVWTVPAGMANVGEVYSSSTMTVFLSGGTAGVSYLPYVTFITVGGKTDKRTIQIVVKDR